MMMTIAIPFLKGKGVQSYDCESLRDTCGWIDDKGDFGFMIGRYM
jgi:hypothetical protein